MNSKTFGRLMVSPTVLILLVVGVFPLIYSLWLIFQRFNTAGEATFVGLRNLEGLLKDKRFIASLGTTAGLMSISLVIDIGLGLLIALSINQIQRFRGIIISLLLLPSVLAPVVVGIIWWLLFDATSGPINYFLQSLFGSPQIEWIVKMPWAYIAVLVATIWQWTPFVSLILLGGLVSIPPSIMEAGKVDGATSWLGFVHITLPLLRPFLLIAGLLQFIDLVKMFDVPYMLTQGGPGSATEATGIYLYRLSFEISSDYGRGAAISWIMVVILSIITAIYIRVIGGKGGALGT